MKKKVLVLAGGLPQIKMIQEFQKRGYFVILADYNQEPVAKPYADRFYCVSTLDLDAILKVAQEERIDLIATCCTDQALNTVSFVSEQLQLPCYVNASTGLAVTNKKYMKKKFVEYGIPTAHYIITNSVEGTMVSSLKFPVVVKPVDCNSSKGVIKANDLSACLESVSLALQFSRTHTAIVEEYIEGQEISVDLFVTDRKAQILCCSYSDIIKENKKFIIYRGIYPAKVPKKIALQIQSVAQKIVDAFYLDNCPMLIQMIYANEEIYVLEFSARTGGSIKFHMIALASGIDIIRATVDAFEGNKVKLTPCLSAKTIVNEFIYCKPGTFESLYGADSCVMNGLIHDYFIFKQPGERVFEARSSSDRVAGITYVADSTTEYEKKHNALIQQLKVIDNTGQDIMRHDLLAQYCITE